MTTTRIKNPATLKSSIDSALSLLRDEWRDSLSGRYASQAAEILRSAQLLAPDHETSIALARAESRLGDYASWPAERRKSELPTIANGLKELLPGVPRAQSTTAQNQRKATVPTRRNVRQIDLDQPVTMLPRVGEAVAKKLSKLDLRTVEDVLRFSPRKHIDYSTTVSILEATTLGNQEEVTIRGSVLDVTSYPGPPPRVSIRLSDSTGDLKVTWFNKFVAQQIQQGTEIAVSGALDPGFGPPSMTGPEWEPLHGPALSTGRLTPVYPLTSGIAQKTLRNLTRNALDATATKTTDYLPPSVLTKSGMIGLRQTFEHLHYPETFDLLNRSRSRLAFDELFLLQVGLLKFKRRRQAAGGYAFTGVNTAVDPFLQSLPFRLTAGQQRALSETLADLERNVPMARLIQGDVGSGKTVVAAASALAAISNGYQVAVMAPTEILAEQHAKSFSALFATLPEPHRPRVELLTGSTRKKQRDQFVHAVGHGEIDLLIGTHALIQGSVAFAKLGLAITDEQHRFGVRQRAELAARSDGPRPHVLSMTATPIPRTLNLILNGDLDVSVIDELPPGRVPIDTRRYSKKSRPEAYDLVRKEIESGRQAFVICPLVEESDSLVAKAAIEEAERLQTHVFPELRVQVLHGRMSGKEKDRIMTAFREGEFDILVSTSVIEVGIDIPNATVMMIEGAERFGLAQLHQFRGRVGRGAHRSFCLLLDEGASSDAEQRLQMMVNSSDGFELAEQDLELRGPGDFVGTRQSGLPDLNAAVRVFDTRILSMAQQLAQQILEVDPELQRADHAGIRQQLNRFWSNAAPEIPLA